MIHLEKGISDDNRVISHIYISFQTGTTNFYKSVDREATKTSRGSSGKDCRKFVVGTC